MAAGCDIVCFSHVRWGPLRERPQHLFTRAARDRRVFFVEDPVRSDGPPHLSMQRADGVIVVTPTLPLDTAAADVPALVRGLIDHLIQHQQLTRFLLWFYTPRALAYADHLAPSAIVYDRMDDLSSLAGAPDDLADLDERLLSMADVVFTAGPGLQAATAARHPHVHCFPDAVDVEHFVQARRLSTREKPPPDQAVAAPPRVGCYGLLDGRVDFGLIAAFAALRPDVSVMMIGPVSRAALSALPRRANVHWLGLKRYDELPYYLAGWSATLLPFVRDASTRLYPVPHVAEHLAAGRALIATPLADLVERFYPRSLIRFAEDAPAISAALDAIRLEPARDRNRRADRWLAAVSWEATWSAMDALLDAASERRARGGSR